MCQRPVKRRRALLFMEPPATSTPEKRSVWLLVGGLGAIVLLVAVMFGLQQARRESGPPLPVISGISQFQLTNQLGRAVTLGDLRGKVTVANVIFTRCPGPCLTMSRQFAGLQRKLSTDGEVRLVSLTIDPEFDTPEILRRYGEKLGTDPDRWWFLTGGLQELRRLAIDDFKFVARPKAEEQMESKDDLFIHSTYFMILDRKARLRAVVESAEPNALEKTMKLVNRLLADS
jgi:protein SCO1/2